MKKLKTLFLVLLIATGFTACSAIESQTESEIDKTTNSNNITDITIKSEIKQQLNFELLSNLGLTLKEIQAKDKSIIKTKEANEIQNLTAESKSESFIFDNNEGKLSDDDSICSDIWQTNAANIFLGLEKEMSITDIERAYEVKLISRSWSDMEGINILVFSYDDYEFGIRTDIKDVIELTSEINVSNISYNNVNRNVYNITYEELNNSKFKYNICQHMVSISKETTVNDFYEDPVIKKISEYGCNITIDEYDTGDSIIENYMTIIINGNEWILEIK